MWWKKEPKAGKRRAVDEVRQFATVIGANVELVGDLTGTDNVQVLGTVRGNCDVRAAFTLGAGGSWTGKLSADLVVIEGHVKGEVYARTKLELQPNAHVTGDLNSPVIAVAEGATFDGGMHMDKGAQVTNFRERRGRGEVDAEPAPAATR